MYGDYSRGHEPDRKRGRSYRRVLLAQGRPVLDSDVAASVDALLGEVRATARGLGCAAGSPDLGFLVTPGRLLAILADAADGLTATGGAPDAWLDYRHRYLGRYPALALTAGGGVAARVTVPVLAPLDPGGGAGRAALWARVEAPVTIAVNGVAVNLAPQSPDVPARFEFDAGALTLDPLEIEVPAGGEVWLFVLEQDEGAGSEPTFWIAPGSYHVDGLIADAQGGGAFPSTSFPPAAGYPWEESPPGNAPLPGLLAPAGIGSGTRLVAYLEVFERHVSHVEDPGIREEALGASDTTARAQLVGQVKLATVGGVPPATVEDAAEQLGAAFASVVQSGGQLTIDVPDSTPSTDPCALPDPAGYSGADNRLYRVEVHDGGGLSQVRLKWSRDNGSELFAARRDGQTLLFDAGTPLAAGDIVEVLSHVVDLGDEALAQVSAGGFVPSQRAVGQLAQLAAVDVTGSSDEVAFTLVDPDDVTVAVAIDDRYGTLPDAVLKLRRWHGILDPQLIAAAGPASPGPHVLEDGITVELSITGAYRPGQHWQYEARVRRENANGPWRPAPHGPERRFAPLALLEYRGASEPLELLAWLDERFSHPCDLDADGIAFAGGRVGSVSDTVQEAIEELFERPPEIVDASCGELIVRTENGLQAVFDTIPAGESARLCIQPGTWELAQTVEVAGKGDLIVSGAGAATRLVGAGIDTVLRFSGCGRIHIQDLVIEGGAAGLVGDGLAGALSVVDCAGLDIERLTASCGDAFSRRMSAVEVRAEASATDLPEVRVHACELRAGNAQVGLLVVNAASADIEGNLVASPAQPWPLEAALADPVVMGRVARLAIDDVSVGAFDDEMLVGGNTLTLTALGGGRNRVEAVIGEWAAAFAFSTTLPIAAAAWEQLFEQNPVPPGGAEATPPEFVRKRLRQLRSQLANVVLGRPNTLNGVTAAMSSSLQAVGIQLRARNNFAAGDQGIVLAGRGTPIDPAFPQPKVLTQQPRPDVRVCNNRVLGFVQGIHVATSGRSHSPVPRGLTYRATISDNTVHLRVPGLAGERHGIFAGSALHLRVHGNTVELRRPQPANWPSAPPIDAIRARGTYGPLLQIVDNTCIGTARGVLAHAINAVVATTPGWRWTVAGNAHARTGAAVPETVNW